MNCFYKYFCSCFDHKISPEEEEEIRKQRNGPTGKVKLAWRGQYTRFDNFVEDPLTYDSPVGKYE